MEVQIVEKTNDVLRLVIHGADVSFINSLRRIMLAEVPSMAIDDVVIIENSSLLPDEILAHRLGLIPIKTDLDSYNLPEECTCKSEFGCNLCRATFTMEVEAANSLTVYSGELKPEDPDIRVVTNKIGIVKLVIGQKIKLEAYAKLGRGGTHAKWQPVSVCAYKHMPQIRIDEARCTKCDECIKICPKNILVRSENEIDVRNLIDCTLCQDCVTACSLNPPAVNVTWNENSFVFNIESNGVLPLERIVVEATRIFNKKIDEFLNQIKSKEITNE